jgi:hypothetical protein
VHSLCIYRIKLKGRVSQKTVNAKSPLQMTVEQLDVDATLLSVQTDQAGLVGLIRHLHGRGQVLLSVSRLHAA